MNRHQVSWGTEEQRRFIAAYTDETIGIEELSRSFGSSPGAIIARARQLGLKRPAHGRSWEAWETRDLRYLYPRHECSIEMIAGYFDRPKQAIIRKAHQMQIRRERPNTYHVRRDYFRTITTTAQAYLLGLFAADGAIANKNGNYMAILALQKGDRAHLEWVRDCLAPEAPLYETRHAFVLQVASKEMVADLASYGIVSGKSYAFAWPRKLPEAFALDFLLGYFDGDGSLNQRNDRGKKRWQWYLLGTLPFLTVAREYIEHYAQVQLREPSPTKRTCPHLYQIYAHNQEVIQRIDRTLNASGLGLARKHF